MTTDTNKQLVRTAFEAMGRSDIRPLVELNLKRQQRRKQFIKNAAFDERGYVKIPN